MFYPQQLFLKKGRQKRCKRALLTDAKKYLEPLPAKPVSDTCRTSPDTTVGKSESQLFYLDSELYCNEKGIFSDIVCTDGP